MLKSGLFILVFALAQSVYAATGCDDLSAINEIYAVDYASEIQPIFNTRCSGCHTNGGNSGGLRLDAGVSFGNLVNVPAGNGSTSKLRVEPFDAERSFMFEKINCQFPDGGSRMPLGGLLSLADQALIRDWINQGAFEEPFVDDVFYDGFESLPPIGP